MRQIAISTWSLAGLLSTGASLLELPAQLAEHGIRVLEVCHFHLPRTDPAYLQAFRAALDAAGVMLYRVLIDTGDITAPDPAQRAADEQTIRDWLAIAAQLGAQQVRIIAGQQPPTPTVIEQSAAQLRAFAAEAAALGLRVSTENWHATAQDPDALLAILDQCHGQVGLCADIGNAEATADKYATLAHLLPRATSLHFKTRYADDGTIIADDLHRCLALVEAAQFEGVITLIYERKQHEWRGIDQLHAAVQPLLAGGLSVLEQRASA